MLCSCLGKQSTACHAKTLQKKKTQSTPGKCHERCNTMKSDDYIVTWNRKASVHRSTAAVHHVHLRANTRMTHEGGRLRGAWADGGLHAQGAQRGRGTRGAQGRGGAPGKWGDTLIQLE